MEQHPVPQNITTFQFRLIGDMTIKQFGYLAGGILLAIIFYKLPLPFFFTWPMAIVAAFAGFGFAFVPIEERPMDIWFFSFLKNVYNPTMFHWEHTEPPPEPPKTLVPPMPSIPSFPAIPHFSGKPAGASAGSSSAPAASQTQQPHPASTPTGQSPASLSRPSASPFDSFFSIIDNLFVGPPKAQPAYVIQRPVVPAPSTRSAIPPIQPPQFMTRPAPVAASAAPSAAPPQHTILPDTREAQEDASAPKSALPDAEKQMKEQAAENDRFAQLQKQLSDLMGQRQAMENEIIALRAKAQTAQNPQPQQFRPAGIVKPAPVEPTIKTMNPDVATRAGLPRLTTYPNVVTGIIKDYDNNMLPGVLVTVKDKEGVPLRALKTNKLGQFAASTQLLNGTYVVEVEDPRERFLFDRVQITVNGTVLPALQIIAKSKRALDREKLEKEIFGTPNASV